MKNHDEDHYERRINALNRIHSIGTLARYRRAKRAMNIACLLLPMLIIALLYAVYVLITY